MKKRIFITIASIISIYIGLCVFVFATQENLMFFPVKWINEVLKKDNIQEVSFSTEDGVQLNGWFIDNKSPITIIFFHGNGGNIYYNQERIRIFDELGVNALLFDYRGYGKSEWIIEKEEDFYIDGQAAYMYVINKWIIPWNIIFWGQSLGNAISINTALDKSIGWIIVESAFISMDYMAKVNYGFLPTGFLLKYHFRNIDKISQIQAPILVIHSIEDELISFDNSEKLFQNAHEPKKFLKIQWGHNTGFRTSYTLYISALREFLVSPTFQ